MHNMSPSCHSLWWLVTCIYVECTFEQWLRRVSGVHFEFSVPFSSRFQHWYFSPPDVQCVSCVLVTDRGVGHAEHISCINLSFLNGQHSFRPRKSLPVSLTPWECGDFPFSHHYQGSTDFNTVNIHRNRDDI